MLALAVLPVFIAICLAVYALVGSAEEKATIRESLRNLSGYEIDNERDRQLLDPLRQRAVVPVISWFTSVGRRLTPVGYVDGIRHKLTLAGTFSPEALDRFLAMRVVSLALIPVWAILSFAVIPLGSGSKLAIFALLTLASVLGPDADRNTTRRSSALAPPDAGRLRRRHPAQADPRRHLLARGPRPVPGHACRQPGADSGLGDPVLRCHPARQRQQAGDLRPAHAGVSAGPRRRSEHDTPLFRSGAA